MSDGPDIFLSYKSEQFSWARRLKDDLERYGFTVFLDHDEETGLKAGRPFAPALDAEIRQARHFFLLWSDKIKVDSYVLKEVRSRQQFRGLVTLLRLDDSATLQDVRSDDHEFRELIELHRKYPDADAVDFFAWNSAVKHIVEQLLGGTPNSMVEIPMVVVAMTNQQAVEVAAGANIYNGGQDDAPTQLMNFLKETESFDPARYGARPEDWKPFEPSLDPSDSLTVEQVIQGFDQEQRQWQQQNSNDLGIDADPHVFLPYGEALRAESTSARARNRLQKGPALVIVDPVSLVHRDVHAEVIQNGLHILSRGFVIGLGPPISSTLEPVRSYYGIEKALFNSLLMKASHERSRSMFGPLLNTCVLNVTHGYELSRWIQVASQGISRFSTEAGKRMDDGHLGSLRAGPRKVPGMADLGSER